MTLQLAVAAWNQRDELSEAIQQICSRLGFDTRGFHYEDSIPAGTDLVFTFGPYGRWNPIARQMRSFPAGEKPVFAHWNTENIPDPRLPWPLMRTMAALRTRMDQLYFTRAACLQKALTRPPLHQWMNRFSRFRYLGDYYHAYRSGWLDLLFDTSSLFTQFHQSHGLPAHYAAWGSVPGWYADLNLERDIDVLWMGKRRTQRRSQLIENVREAAAGKGYTFLSCDGTEKPFIFGEERTKILNRTKITLNILAGASHDNILPFRFALSAANGSMVISEPELKHCPCLKPGIHYIVSSYDDFPATVQYYLEHETERARVVQAARGLIDTEFNIENSLRGILEESVRVYQTRAAGENMNVQLAARSTSL